jgi:ketosteroid isomerase-like protein
MSENLDLVRSIYADWERGDFSGGDWADPEIEFVQVAAFDAGTWKGLAAMAEANREWLSTWEQFRICADEFSEIDAERVLVLFHRTGRGKASGLEVGQIQAQGANLFHLRCGKVTRLVAYFDRDRAFADLGLEA